MIDTIHHVVRISARRDRTEINSALLDALTDLFHPQSLTIYQCYPGNQKPIAYPCAGLNREGRFVRNAYLPDRTRCITINTVPYLKQCQREQSTIYQALDDDLHRLVYPVMSLGQPIYMIEIVLSEAFSADQRAALLGLLEYFGNHIALLNYGEADTLTGLQSRKTFEKHLFELLGHSNSDSGPGTAKTARRHGESADSRHWLAVCDIDHFKSINDNFGHLIGDEVLILLAQVMRNSFRFDDQLFRFGGEEFVVLLQPASRESAQATLERFRHNIETSVFSRVGHVTISIGFSQLLPHDTPANVVDRADEALYYAKAHGRNRVTNYELLVEKGELDAKETSGGDVELF